MTDHAPVVYILHGEDEFAIAQFLNQIEQKLGDPSAAMMNITRLDGRSYDRNELLSAVSAMPFLTKRRLVILTHPLTQITNEDAQVKFLDLLDKIPPTTALVLVEYKMLTNERKKRQGEFHWLEEWAESNPSRTFVRAFPLPKGGGMAYWIQKQAVSHGGKITPQAADRLASLIGEDTRLADQEIQKLLAYVNYQRVIEPDDVEYLVADIAQGNIFELVDALGILDGKKAFNMLQRLLEKSDPLYIFAMIVRQFRLLLLAREVLDQGGSEAQVLKVLGGRPWNVHPFPAGKISKQATHFSLLALEGIYHRLLEFDLAVKTGKLPAGLALDTMVVEFTNQQVKSYSR